MRRKLYLQLLSISVVFVICVISHLATADQMPRKVTNIATEIFDCKTWPAILRRDAEKGIAEAQTNLALAYQNGICFSRNSSEAASWFKRAALQDYKKAQMYLGSLYLAGDGVKEDRVRSYMWSYLAGDYKEISTGIPFAQVAVNLLRNVMTREQIASAEQMADKCRKSNFKNCD